MGVKTRCRENEEIRQLGGRDEMRQTKTKYLQKRQSKGLAIQKNSLLLKGNLEEHTD